MPTPLSTRALLRRRANAGIRSQNLILFIRGKIISGEFNIRGMSQLPNLPMRTGMTKKKIMRNAWAVTSVLYSWSLPNREPG